MNRIKQLIWAITSRYKNIDGDFLKKYLNENELSLFNKLNISEKHHSIRVCKDSIEYINNSSIKNKIDTNKMAKIALLHDIGKINKSLSVFDKCMVVILDKVTKGGLKKFNNNMKIDVYYNHGRMAYELLKNIGNYDKEFLQAVQMHHSKETYKNIYLQILKEMDDKN
ncbi:HD domain-containing protein [Clostridium sp. HCP1S3_B4]|uniref:HD domain-containing protein n=1 Tax=unclassified Clostridium TaxID=2614128 RepID=UPI0016B3D0EA|nr:HD domain-containing protein [Clostridiales bacterium]MDY2730476.1 HD domain-containing protein [Clostridium sp.]NLK22540.1 HD domain-containing protein [Clostridiales bacterium]